MHTFIFRSMAAVAAIFIACGTAAAQGKGFYTKRMDTTVDACTDFFQYANGAWLRSTEIPATESRWGTFNILGDNNNSTLRQILENAAKTKAAADSDAHTTSQLRYVETAIAHARLAAIPSDRLVNSWPADRLLTWLADRRSMAA